MSVKQRQFDSRIAIVLGISLLLGPVWAAPSWAGTAEDLVVENTTLVGTRRVSRTGFEFTYRAEIRNAGSGPCTGGVATLTSVSANTVVVDGSVSFGEIAPGGARPSVDTFTIHQDRTIPFDPAALVWEFVVGLVGEQVPFTPAPVPDLTDPNLPDRLPNGNLMFAKSADGQLEIDPTLSDPITALGACLSLVTQCLLTGAGSLDDCTRSAPVCTTSRPWEEAEFCCSADCYLLYNGARLAGQSPVDAFLAAYTGSVVCFPGVSELLSGQTE